jgi:hypothetical protein
MGMKLLIFHEGFIQINALPDGMPDRANQAKP